MSPAHRSSERRWRVLALVVLVLAGVGVGAGTRGTAAPVGGRGGAGRAGRRARRGIVRLVLHRAVHRSRACRPASSSSPTRRRGPVSGTITAVTDTGATVRTAVAVPAAAWWRRPSLRCRLGPGSPRSCHVSGGGVAVTQAVHGASGWSQAPCQSTTSASWYFAGGTTADSDTLYVSLLNPTSTPVVVDLSFMTPAGRSTRSTTRGSCCNPGRCRWRTSASEVQDVSTVSTVVSTRTGRVVASEVQVFAGRRPPASLWCRARRSPSRSGRSPGPGGRAVHSEIDVFNPGSGTETRDRAPAPAVRPLAPLTATVPGGSTWALATSAQTRIPA